MDAQRREQLLDDLTRRIEKMGMTAPAILFLETYKPLAFLGAQLLWFAQPFLSLGFKEADFPRPHSAHRRPRGCGRIA